SGNFRGSGYPWIDSLLMYQKNVGRLRLSSVLQSIGWHLHLPAGGLLLMFFGIAAGVPSAG
ncbi:MAG: hypothetical protein ABF504_15500, partial [Komagataeibacter saccharivorans]|uniref:hypothetical protein n=1 Tax=Komagataeibacter saccharivorans TaxID=265959 RepID=UPI0039ED6E28